MTLDISNRSSEHILLNAIGGKLKSDDLLCKLCNSFLGLTCDAELAKQISFLSTHLGVSRKGDNPDIKDATSSDGTKYRIAEGGIPSLAKPKVVQTPRDGGFQISVTARNERELADILKGLNKKHPGLNIEEAIKSAVHTNDYLNESVQIQTQIGGDLAFKSLVKTAINFYVLKRQEKSEISHLISYLKGSDSPEIIKHFIPDLPVVPTEDDEIIHTIYLVGNKNNKILYCYIELFSIYGFIILLHREYNGEDFTHSYCFDVMSSQEVVKSINLKMTASEFDTISLIEQSQRNIIVEKFTRAVRIGDNKQSDHHTAALLQASAYKIFGDEKINPIITEELLQKFVEDSVSKFIKFLYRGKK